MTPRAIRDLFVRERSRYAEVYPHAEDARLVIVDGMCPEPPCQTRDFATTDMDTLVVSLSKRATKLRRDNVLGLIRHELGHVCDKSWRSGAEQRADNIAERVTGEKIRYDHNFIQTIGAGTYPRPSWLPR